MTRRDGAEDSKRHSMWGDLLVDSPWRIFLAVLLVALSVEAVQDVLRRLVLPEVPGIAGLAVDALWLPSLLGLLLWRVIVLPLHTSLAGEVDQIRHAEVELRDRTDRLLFDGQLRRALETVEDEDAVLAVVDRATALAGPEFRSRLLLAGTNGEVRLAAGHEPAEAPGCCALASTDDCPVIRSGQATQFASTEPLDTCPMLLTADVPAGAVCFPVTVLGETAGVLTSSFPEGGVPEETTSEKLETVAARTGSRLSLVRALADSRRQATTDSLTRLVNRRALRAAHSRARARGGEHSVLLLDLDHFKQLNDTHGHDTGDAALLAFADVLRGVLRPEDVAARIGGEEFAVLLPDTDLAAAVTVAERIREAQARHAATVGPATTVSIGVAGPGAGPELATLLQAADGALYAAKEAGRDRVAVATDDAPTVVPRDGDDQPVHVLHGT